MPNLAYFDCLSGISGDMTLGALIDLGADPNSIQAAVQSMGLPELRIETAEVKKCGFRAVSVSILHPPEHAHRHLHHITEMIDQASDIDAGAKQTAHRIFHQLAEAEAKVHGTTLQKVHFHEVGAIDSIADIVGSAVALQSLGIERISASPVPTGTGSITIAHGRVSVPAPATAELLAGIPIATSNIDAELTTPTGAAILKACASSFGPLPEMTIDAVGYGAGNRDLDEQANVLRVMLGKSNDSLSGVQSDQVVVLETNIDDATPQQLADCADRLLAAGALDVVQLPCTMKKGRAAVVLTVIASDADAGNLEQIMFQHSTSIGIRRSHVSRHKLHRQQTTVETKFGTVRVKVVTLPDGNQRATAEDDDVRTLAASHHATTAGRTACGGGCLGVAGHMSEGNGNGRQAAVAFILVTLFIDILGIGIVIPVLPDLVRQLVGDDSPVQAESLVSEASSTATEIDSKENFARAGVYVGVIGSVYALMQFLFAPILGALSDRFGRRPVLLISLFGLGVDFVIQGLAPNIWWLFAGRLIAGIFGANFSTANAYIADVSTDDNRARNFGFVGMMFGLGFTLGPAIGGILGNYSLRLPFFVAAALALINCCYGYFVLPESLPPEKRSRFRVKEMHPFATLAKMRAYPIVWGLAMVLVCKSLAQRGLENVWVLYAGYRYGWDTFTNGLILGLVGVSAIVVQGGLVRPTIRRFGERKTVIGGTIISAIAFLGYGTAYEGWMVPWIIVFGAIGGLAGPALQSLIAGAVDESEQGTIQGGLVSLTSLTNVFAPVLFNTLLFSYFISDAAPIHLPGAPFLVGSMLITLSIFVALGVFRRVPEHDD